MKHQPDAGSHCISGPPGFEPGTDGYEPSALTLSYRPDRVDSIATRKSVKPPIRIPSDSGYFPMNRLSIIANFRNYTVNSSSSAVGLKRSADARFSSGSSGGLSWHRHWPRFPSELRPHRGCNLGMMAFPCAGCIRRWNTSGGASSGLRRTAHTRRVEWGLMFEAPSCFPVMIQIFPSESW